MRHVDEGTIHAWLDGALPPAEAERVERHVRECGECEALVAEARGLIAASSRILASLDDVPAGVLPEREPTVARDPLATLRARRARDEVASSRARRWWRRPELVAAAALVFVAVGTTTVLRRARLDGRPGAAVAGEAATVQDSAASVAGPAPAPPARSATAPEGASRDRAATAERDRISRIEPGRGPGTPPIAGPQEGVARAQALPPREAAAGAASGEQKAEVAPAQAGAARRPVAPAAESDRRRVAGALTPLAMSPGPAAGNAAGPIADSVAGCYEIEPWGGAGGLPLRVVFDSARAPEIADGVWFRALVMAGSPPPAGAVPLAWRAEAREQIALMVERDGSRAIVAVTVASGVALPSSPQAPERSGRDVVAAAVARPIPCPARR